MTFSASQITQIIGGRLEGDGQVSVSSFGKIEEARQGQLSFLANPKYEDYLYTTNASIIIIGEDFTPRQTLKATLIRVKDAYTAFATLLAKYQEIQQQQLRGVQQPSYIAPSAKHGENVYVGAFAYIGENVQIGHNTKIYPHCYIGDNVSIGDNTVINAGVKIYHNCQLGNHVTVHAGTVIGSDGFGFAPQPDGSFKKVPQIGNVLVEDYVEIGSNSTIDRATIGSTIIRKGAKLDNLIQIAHNVEIGSNSVIAAQAGISGSTKIGKSVMIGGQVGIVGHLQIGDKVRINAQSGVTKSLEEGKAVTGSPAFDYTSSLRSQALSRKLPEMEKKIKELESLVAQLRSAAGVVDPHR